MNFIPLLDSPLPDIQRVTKRDTDRRRLPEEPWPFGQRAQDEVVLTERQVAVLEFVVRGYPNKQIAAALGISVQGAKQDVSALLSRFGLPNRAALVHAAMKMKLLGTSSAPDIPVEYLFDRAPVMIAMTSGPEHVFTVVNRKYIDLFGPRRYVGRPFRTVFRDLSGPVIVERLDAVFRDGQPFGTDELLLAWQGPDGRRHERYVALLIEPTRHSDGSVAGLVLYGWELVEEVRLRAWPRSAPGGDGTH